MPVSKRATAIALMMATAVVAGCGAGAMGADNSSSASAASGGQDYGATKQMVLDILHSPEGKSALYDILKDPTFKQQLAVSNADVSKALTASLQSEKFQHLLSEQMKDPTFASDLAKASQPEMLSTMKQLLRDPDAQKDLLVLLKSKSFSTFLEEQFQSPEGRKDIMNVMMQAMDNPTFRMKFQDALKKAVSDSMKSPGDSGNSSQQQSSGGSAEGESGSGGEEGNQESGSS